MPENTPNQPFKFRIKNWVEMNDDAFGTYSTNSQIKSKTSLLKSSLCDYSDAYIAVKGTITVSNTETAAAQSYANKVLAFKNCAPFTDFISETNNTEIDNAKDIDEVMNMHNLIEYSKNYSQTSVSLWKYPRD